MDANAHLLQWNGSPVFFASEEQELQARKRQKLGRAPPNLVVDASLRLEEVAKSGVTLSDVQKLILYLNGEEQALNWVSVKNRGHIGNICLLVLSGSHAQLCSQKWQCIHCLSPCATRMEVPHKKPQKYSFIYELLYRTPPSRRGPGGITKKSVSPDSDQRPGPDFYILTPHQLLQYGYPVTEPLPPTFVQSALRPADSVCPKNQRVLGLDCEMCRTKMGHELARVTLVDSSFAVIYDKLVKPYNEITDYCTPYSGITAEVLHKVDTRLETVQQELLGIIYADTILLGHSLQNDLKALHLVHHRVIDTAVLFPHPKGPPHQPALRFLAHKYLRKSIQGFQKNGQQQSAHSSIEDATVCLELLELKLQHGPQLGAEGAKQHILEACHEAGQFEMHCVDRRDVLQRCMPPDCATVPVESDADALARATGLMSAAGARRMLWVHLQELLGEAGDDAAAASNGAEPGHGKAPDLRKLDGAIDELYAAAPANTVFVVLSGQGNAAAAPEGQPEARELDRQGLLWLFVKR